MPKRKNLKKVLALFCLLCIIQLMEDELFSFRASGYQGLEQKMNVNESVIKQISADEMVAAMQRQVAELGRVGETDLFGEIRTESDIAHALSEVSRVAEMYAAELRSR